MLIIWNNIFLQHHILHGNCSHVSVIDRRKKGRSLRQIMGSRWAFYARSWEAGELFIPDHVKQVRSLRQIMGIWWALYARSWVTGELFTPDHGKQLSSLHQIMGSWLALYSRSCVAGKLLAGDHGCRVSSFPKLTVLRDWLIKHIVLRVTTRSACIIIIWLLLIFFTNHRSKQRWGVTCSHRDPVGGDAHPDCPHTGLHVCRIQDTMRG